MTIDISHQELRDKNAIDLGGALSSTSFWHYTSAGNANKILHGQFLLLSPLTECNDRNEAKRHKDDGSGVYIACFCNTNTESIPLWYLYSGIRGKGAALGFRPKGMKAWLGGIATVRGYRDKDHTDQFGELEVGKDVDLACGWVFYQKQGQPEEICYRGQWYRVDDAKAFGADNYFLKDNPWNYEKEFRIILRNRTSTPYARLGLSFSTVFDDVMVRTAPECTEDDLKDLFRNDGFAEYGLRCLNRSKLSITMNVIKRNCDDILKVLSDGGIEDKIINQIKGIIEGK